MYGAQPPSDPSLRAAIRTIHRDRGWWHKIAVGGLLFLSVLGWPIAEGFLLESIENSQRGYATPLPRWADLSTKALIGLFGVTIDFFFLIFPLLLGSMAVLCGTLGVSVFAAGQVRVATGIALGVMLAAYELTIILSSAPVVSKLAYVREGDIAAALNMGLVREGFRGPAWRTLLAVRLRSLPLAVLALAVVVEGVLLELGTWQHLLVIWIGLSLLFYVRLLTIQLYVAAGTELERRRFESLRRR